MFSEARVETIRKECLDIAILQAEEVFCDAFGVLLFHESYLYAFDAFVMPGFGDRGSIGYPNLLDRVKYIKACASGANISLRSDILDEADIRSANSPRRESAEVLLSDKIVADALQSIVIRAGEFVKLLELDKRKGESVEDIKKNLLTFAPARDPKSCVEVLNAVWSVYFELTQPSSTAEELTELHRKMNNLCLKSLEIYEYRKAPQL